MTFFFAQPRPCKKKTLSLSLSLSLSLHHAKGTTRKQSLISLRSPSMHCVPQTKTHKIRKRKKEQKNKKKNKKKKKKKKKKRKKKRKRGRKRGRQRQRKRKRKKEDDDEETRFALTGETLSNFPSCRTPSSLFPCALTLFPFKRPSLKRRRREKKTR